MPVQAGLGDDNTIGPLHEQWTLRVVAPLLQLTASGGRHTTLDTTLNTAL